MFKTSKTIVKIPFFNSHFSESVITFFLRPFKLLFCYIFLAFLKKSSYSSFLKLAIKPPDPKTISSSSYKLLLSD